MAEIESDQMQLMIIETQATGNLTMDTLSQTTNKKEIVQPDPRLFASPWVALYIALKNGAQRSGPVNSKQPVKNRQN